MVITPLIAALLGFMYIGLSIGVIKHRITNKVSHGDNNDSDLRKAIRIHANFSEYIPLSLILLFFVEMTAKFDTIVVVLGCVLILSRICHMIGMKNSKSYLILRQIGTLAIIIVIAITSSLLLFNHF